MTDYGTDKLSLQNTTGAIQSNAGDPLLSTDDFGASAYAFGPALSAGIYLGVQNGNIGAPTAAVGTADPISDNNPLPYFSSSDGSSGRITAAVVEDATSGSGYVVRFTMVNALSADEFYLERIISVPASRATTATFQPRGAWTAATNNANYRAFTRAQYIVADGTTTTGAAGTGEATGASIFAFNSTAREVQANPNTTGVAPTDAAFLRVRVGVRLTADIVGTATIDLVEVRLDSGRTQYILTDADQPNSYGYGAVFESFGDLIIRPNETGLSGSNPSLRLRSSNGDIVIDPSKLGSNGSAVLGGNIYLQHDTTNGKVWFGGSAGASPSDTNLYRSAANSLKTDDSFTVQSDFSVNGTTVNFSGGSVNIGADVNIYRSAANTLKTDDSFVAANVSAGSVAAVYYFGNTDFTGAVFQLGGSNNRLWSFSSSAGAADVIASNSVGRSGILITKATTGQPTTNINGTGGQDAFADGLRNGGLAIDSSNNRGYWYSNGWKYTALTTPSDSRLKKDIEDISGAIEKLKELVPVAFKWRNPDAHQRTDAVADNEVNYGFIADQVATTSLAHWVEDMGVDDREKELVEDGRVMSVNIPQNEIEAIIVQAILDIENRLTALENR